MKTPVFVLVFLILSTFSSFAGTTRNAPSQPSQQQWQLVWNDEFDGPDGSAPDAAKWSFVVEGNGFGNQELEYYTARPENTHIEKGHLVITARKERFTGADGVTREYTSGRINSQKKFEQQYGRVEARIRIPKGQGIWPAFWMLGNDVGKVGWPQCGEIDIMENVGFEPEKVHGSLHGPGYSGANPLSGAYSLPKGKRLADEFHLFAVEWEPNAIRFYVDDALFETQTPGSVPQKQWVFDHPFYLLLNVAVGGNWPGDPNASTEFPASMLVDYVRVYRKAALSK
ncbi:MAG TPA: glycoside hydrolase family 16 protein [Candidatus Saccharimonadales bacterium]|nr:glycoside hydrolase family 16 protein [Candidatus Saccharimonadales bacterium]